MWGRGFVGSIVVGLLVAGCAYFGYQPATVSRPRDQVWKENGDFKQLVGYVEGYGTALCEFGKVPPDLCAKGKGVLDQVKARIRLEEEAALLKAETIDVAALNRAVLPLLNQYISTLGPLAAGALKLAPGLL